MNNSFHVMGYKSVVLVEPTGILLQVIYSILLLQYPHKRTEFCESNPKAVWNDSGYVKKVAKRAPSCEFHTS